MMEVRHNPFSTVVVLALLSVLSFPSSLSVLAVDTMLVKGGFSQPVGVEFDPLPRGGSQPQRMFVVEKGGKVRETTFVGSVTRELE